MDGRVFFSGNYGSKLGADVDRMMVRQFLFVALAITVTLFVQPTFGATVIEKRIATQNPCKNLKVKIGTFTIGIDKLKDVTVEEATVSLVNEEVTVLFRGGLACETSNAAKIQADASLHVFATAKAKLDNCEILDATVALSKFGGTQPGALKAFAGTIESILENEIEKGFRDACLTFQDRQ